MIGPRKCCISQFNPNFCNNQLLVFVELLFNDNLYKNYVFSFQVLGILVVISYSTPLFIIVIVPLFVMYCVIQRFYIASSRQLKRLDSVSRSPMYSHFGETLTGLQTIRAYAQQERFISECYSRIDQNQMCHFPQMTAYRWLAIRLEVIGNLIIFFAALFAVLAKDQSPGLVGLSITYSLQVIYIPTLLDNFIIIPMLFFLIGG